MKEVTVKKEALLLKLKENRITHEKEYDEMMKNYHNKVISGLETLLSKAMLNAKNPVTHLDLPQPKSYLSEYDLIISMIEMSMDSNFTLTQTEYKNYVLNEWNWSGQFDMLKTTYSGKLNN
jgi:hypothetical protein